MRQILKDARTRANMTQREVAQHLGINIRYYQKLEAGTSTGRCELWDSLEALFDYKYSQPQLRTNE